MPQCIDFTVKGTQCSRAAAPPHMRCFQHHAQYVTAEAALGEHQEGKCIMRSRHLWCANNALPGQHVCQTHLEITAARAVRHAEAAEARRRENEQIDELVTNALDEGQRWQVYVMRLSISAFNNVTPYQVANIAGRRIFGVMVQNAHERMRWFHDVWRWAWHGGVGQEPVEGNAMQPVLAHGGMNFIIPVQFVDAGPRAPAPAVTLGAIARDNQNVHRADVSNQTNAGMEKLLAAGATIAVARKYRSPDWFASKWLPETYGSWDRVARVVNDMQRWYNTATCRTRNDWLYKKALDGLYTLVRKTKDDDTRKELYKRVFEECNEAVDMCCDGHISRICNVLVGFDEAFQTPVSTGEVLQNRMSAIAALEIETNEKVRRATNVLNELKIPDDQRSAWLEAF